MAYITAYGHERLFFGSDFPFGSPVREFAKIRQLPVSGDVKTALMGENIRALLKTACPPR
jgi:predicted TIM-barrel fold metal-dependent hydrolase